MAGMKYLGEEAVEHPVLILLAAVVHLVDPVHEEGLVQGFSDCLMADARDRHTTVPPRRGDRKVFVVEQVPSAAATAS
jgi:hypothetical protein